MDKIKLEILGLSSSQSQSGSFALVLGESKGKRRLPIIIGMFEAQAIAIEIEKIAPNRPMTHDLFKYFAKSFDFTVIEVIISSLREGVFFSKIVCKNEKGNISIDARPSDAIAIGIRFNAPIYTTDSILNEAGIEITDEEVEEGEDDSEVNLNKEELGESTLLEEKTSSESELQHLSLNQLNTMLNKAVGEEDYELAARIRDELSIR